MNLKERGLTVGDILIILIIIISTILVTNKIKDTDKQINFQLDTKEILTIQKS